MNKPEFADHFIMALYNKIPRRPDLVREVSRILRIEQEPASRRLNGSVKFSVNEMGKLSRELGISLDNLMHSENGRIESQAVLETLWRYESIDSLAELIEGHLDIAEGIYPASAEYGCVLDSISLSMAVHHQNIFKLLLFKWGHLFVDSDEFGDYASWNIPRRFTDIRKRLQYLQEKGKGVICVCDDMFVHSIIREVNHLYSVNAMDTGSKNEIKA